MLLAATVYEDRADRQTVGSSCRKAPLPQYACHLMPPANDIFQCGQHMQSSRVVIASLSHKDTSLFCADNCPRIYPESPVGRMRLSVLIVFLSEHQIPHRSEQTRRGKNRYRTGVLRVAERRASGLY